MQLFAKKSKHCQFYRQRLKFFILFFNVLNIFTRSFLPVLFNVLTSLANSYLFRSPCHFLEETIIVKMNYTGGSPGLVVMGGDLCSEGRDFESQHHIRVRPDVGIKRSLMFANLAKYFPNQVFFKIYVYKKAPKLHYIFRQLSHQNLSPSF